MGLQHGRAFGRDIVELALDRVALAGSERWAGRQVSRPEVLELAQACLPYHEAYAPALVEELRGIGEAAGVGLAELIVLNGFTDFVDTVHGLVPAPDEFEPLPAHPGADNCTAFIVRPAATSGGHGFLGQTWDMHDTATPSVMLLRGRPLNGPAFLTLTMTGCVGMMGMNDAGIAVGINNLKTSGGQLGVTWPFVVRQVLAQDNLSDALACVTDATLAGGHNYLLVDAGGDGYNVEAMVTGCHVQQVDGRALVHTNHCLHGANVALERPRLPESRASSEGRLLQATELLDRGQLDLDQLMALTRLHGEPDGICVHSAAPLFVETCGAAIMRPATREMWAVWGHPCRNDYERFEV